MVFKKNELLDPRTPQCEGPTHFTKPEGFISLGIHSFYKWGDKYLISYYKTLFVISFITKGESKVSDRTNCTPQCNWPNSLIKTRGF